MQIYCRIPTCERSMGRRAGANSGSLEAGGGFIVALFAMFVLLTMEFKSYFQPFNHCNYSVRVCRSGIWPCFLGMPLTIFSMFGLVALAGVVVNDSIVLIDFINHRVRSVPFLSPTRGRGDCD